MTTAVSSVEVMRTADGVPLKVKLRRAERRRKAWALALIAPLFVFLIATFIVPIMSMLVLGVRNPEIPKVLPRTSAAIAEWEGIGLPDEDVLEAFVSDMREAKEARIIGRAGKRLNYDISGFRSLMLKTGRRLPPPDTPSSELAAKLIKIDKRWAKIEYWSAIKKAAMPITDFYLLAALDRTRDTLGNVVKVPDRQSIYVVVLVRTFWISLVVTVACLLLGYPLAYLLATLPTRISNLLMILVLLPFWTSLLVRTTAWLVLLQRQGVLNDLAVYLGLYDDRIQLIHNRAGVYIAMVHILLPFMVLPIYSVMKGVSPTHMRAAASLGATPVRSFIKVYMPQTIPGVGAGVLLVFILSLGYYITPALVGGPQDQLLSYFIAFHTNQTLNWGMAAALSMVLLLLVLIFFVIYNRLVGIDKMKLG